MPINPLILWRIGSFIAICAAIIGAGLYLKHLVNQHDEKVYKQGEANVQAKWDAAVIEAQQENLRKKAEYDKQRKQADDERVSRETFIRKEADSANLAVERLRNELASARKQLSSLSADAIRIRAETYGIVLSECSERYEQLGREIEIVNSEKQTLIDAWPK